MAQALIDYLTGKARAAFPTIAALAETAKSAQEIVSELRAAGLGFRNQNMLDIVAVLRNKADYNRYVRTFGENAPIPTSLHTPSVTTTDKNFSYLVELQNAPETLPEFVTVTSDVALSANDIFATATSFLSNDRYNEFDESQLSQITLDIQEARYSPNSPAASDLGYPSSEG